jgi:hypothetical protein
VEAGLAPFPKPRKGTKMSKQPDNAAVEAGIPSSQMLMNTENFMMSLARLNGLALQSILRMNVEAMSFVKHRYEQDVKILDALVKCEGINEAMNTYTQFMKDTGLHPLSETR